MVDVPCLDYLWDGQKDCPGDGQIKRDKREITRNMPHCMLLGLLWQSCHVWITCRTICRVVLVMTDHITCGTISHVRLSHAQWTDMEKPILPNLGKILPRSSQVPGNLSRLTNVGLHSSISTLVVHTHQVPLSTHLVPLAKNEK